MHVHTSTTGAVSKAGTDGLDAQDVVSILSHSTLHFPVDEGWYNSAAPSGLRSLTSHSEILAALGDERWRIQQHTSVAWLLLVAEGGEWSDRFAENGSQ